MKIVSFNIQYSKGADGKHDISRIADVVRDADIIGLQEVVRNWPSVPEQDQPGKLSQLLPDCYTAYGATLDIDIGSNIENGRATSTRFNFGNLLLSKWPILSTRLIQLPWSGLSEAFDMQNSVLEGVIDCPGGPIRVYVTHLNFRRGSIRARQLEYLIPKIVDTPNEGIGVSGRPWDGLPIPPTPEDAILIGDFNLTPNCDEYDLIVGENDLEFGRQVSKEFLVDSWVRTGHDENNAVTWYDHKIKSGKRLDYGFVSSSLVHRVKSAWIDHDCIASDHQPYWFELAD